MFILRSFQISLVFRRLEKLFEMYHCWHPKLLVLLFLVPIMWSMDILVNFPLTNFYTVSNNREPGIFCPLILEWWVLTVVVCKMKKSNWEKNFRKILKWREGKEVEEKVRLLMVTSGLNSQIIQIANNKVRKEIQKYQYIFVDVYKYFSLPSIATNYKFLLY